jgi:hypothetical protein
LALRGQEEAPQELIDFEYRKLFGLSQKELLDEPSYIYETNIGIIFLKHKLQREANRREEKRRRRNL